MIGLLAIGLALFVVSKFNGGELLTSLQNFKIFDFSSFTYKFHTLLILFLSF